MGESDMNAAGQENPAFNPSGSYGLAEASDLKEQMLDALARCGGTLVVDLSGVESADLTFFQLLFALSAQARLDGKKIVLGAPLPEPLRRAAGELGIAQRDFEQAFSSGDVQ